MKKLTIISCSVFVGIVSILMLLQPARASSDSSSRPELSGTWVWALDNMRCTYVVLPDGSFTSQDVFSHSTRTNTYQRIGTWIVKDGNFIETIKSDTNKSAPSPRSHEGRIIRADAYEFAVRWQSSTNETVWQRVTK